MDAVELDPAHELVLDLEAMTLSSRAGTIQLEMNEGARQQLLEGTWDAVRALLSSADETRATADRLPYLNDFRS